MTGAFAASQPGWSTRGTFLGPRDLRSGGAVREAPTTAWEIRSRSSESPTSRAPRWEPAMDTIYRGFDTYLARDEPWFQVAW